MNDIVQDFIEGKINIHIPKGEISLLEELGKILPIKFNSGRPINSSFIRKHIQYNDNITLYADEGYGDYDCGKGMAVFYATYLKLPSIKIDDFIKQANSINVTDEEIENLIGV